MSYPSDNDDKPRISPTVLLGLAIVGIVLAIALVVFQVRRFNAPVGESVTLPPSVESAMFSRRPGGGAPAAPMQLPSPPAGPPAGAHPPAVLVSGSK